MASVRKSTGTYSLNCFSVNLAKKDAPLLCHVSSTKSSLRIFPPHFWHCKNIWSTHGLCSSKCSFGFSKALSRSSFLLVTASFAPHFSHFHMGSGAPQTLSLETHQGLPSFKKAINRFLGLS